jgi:hypothetical protein
MQIKGQVNLFLFYHLRKGIGGFFGERSLFPARKCPVQIPAFRSGQFLSGRVETEDGIGPLMYGIGQPGTESESSFTLSREQTELSGASLLGIIMGKTALIGLGNDKKRSPPDMNIFHKQDGGYESGGFIGVHSANNKHTAPRFLSLKNIDIGIRGGPGDTGKIGTQSCSAGQVFIGKNIIRSVHLPKFTAAHKTHNQYSGQQEGGGKMLLFH